MCLISDYLGRKGYTVLEIIDQSVHRTIYKARHNKTGAIVVIKVLPNSNNSHRRNVYDHAHEIQIMKMLDHPLTVDFYDAFSDDERTYIVMEYLPRGSLFEYILQNGKLSEQISNNIFTQLISAIDYLHNELHIVHRDIKAENVLLDQNFNVRLIDFGLAGRISKIFPKLDFSCGSIGYMAPEIFSGHGYDEQVDIWSTGVLLFALLTGYLPFSGQNSSDIKHNILHQNIEFPDYLSKDAKNLLSKMLERNPTKRISIQGIKQHSWFSFNQYNAISDFTHRIGHINSIILKPDQLILADIEALGIKTENLGTSLFMKDCTEATTAFKIIRRQRIDSEMLY
ncbi:CAMK family protein kinase [Trichomonas vaginalis G3]|uniref:CAMK family protein kinase n=1 Tax=Trichomonas vaginalis (strain ATCC PRA-98 / G3) TaxID=412133 RepID=A2FCK2_TRIV3|nr:protein serine/threonine kinase protein [Trichomonas vaginalis G3]EAX97361.1 CAMK family protein kinase [Trichomonas vaginalis G3]KAI5496521.1 protein serine/threonine kinase protein [Trichomonas vaginalis G3]|eukprot:XP_001310291.1 CAMK family protein kinase [Trichomonas vaginalis G3]